MGLKQDNSVLNCKSNTSSQTSFVACKQEQRCSSTNVLPCTTQQQKFFWNFISFPLQLNALLNDATFSSHNQRLCQTPSLAKECDALASQEALNFNPNIGPEESQSLTMGPGLYAVICSAAKKVYFGESALVVLRLGRHFQQLAAGNHECQEMQKDWVTYGPSSFSFISLSIGPQWTSSTNRIEMETKLILDNKDSVYNQSIAGSTKKKPSDIYKKAVRYKDSTYPSIAAAHRATGISPTHIRRLVHDSQNLEWSYAENPNMLDESNIVNLDQAKMVKIGDKVYRSIRQAAKETSISRRTLSRYLDSTKPEHSHITYVEE
jgi:group I intron endonuclease